MFREAFLFHINLIFMDNTSKNNLSSNELRECFPPTCSHIYFSLLYFHDLAARELFHLPVCSLLALGGLLLQSLLHFVCVGLLPIGATEQSSRCACEIGAFMLPSLTTW